MGYWENACRDFMDIEMPEMDGIQVRSGLAKPLYPGPFIVLTISMMMIRYLKQ